MNESNVRSWFQQLGPLGKSCRKRLSHLGTHVQVFTAWSELSQFYNMGSNNLDHQRSLFRCDFNLLTRFNPAVQVPMAWAIRELTITTKFVCPDFFVQVPTAWAIRD